MDPFVKEGEPVKQQPVEQQPPGGKKSISNIAQAQNAAPGGEVSPTHGEAITEHLVSMDHLEIPQLCGATLGLRHRPTVSCHWK